MPQTRSISAVRQVLVVVGAVFAGAMSSAGEATADCPVAFRSQLGDVCLDAPNGDWPSNVMINPSNRKVPDYARRHGGSEPHELFD
jgi:hypothetical protein